MLSVFYSLYIALIAAHSWSPKCQCEQKKKKFKIQNLKFIMSNNKAFNKVSPVYNLYTTNQDTLNSRQLALAIQLT